MQVWTQFTVDNTCSCMDHVWTMYGPYMVHTWSIHDPYMVHTWSIHGHTFAFIMLLYFIFTYFDCKSTLISFHWIVLSFPFPFLFNSQPWFISLIKALWFPLLLSLFQSLFFSFQSICIYQSIYSTLLFYLSILIHSTSFNSI